MGHPHWLVQVPRLRCCTNAYGYTYSHSHSNVHANRDRHIYTYRYGCGNSHVYSDCYGDVHADCQCDVHTDGDSDSDVYSDRYGDVYAYCYRDVHTDGDGDLYTDSYSYVYAHSDSHVYADRYSDVYAYCHCDIHTDGDCHSNCNSYSYSDANTVASCADGIERYQSDCQQLYCELDQCQRCDELPVRRIYEQFLCHLRRDLSRSACRRNQSKRHWSGREHVLLLPGPGL